MANRWLSLLFPTPAVRSPKPRPPARTAELTIEAGGREILVAIRRNARAKRYTLRLTARGDAATVTIPKRGTLTEARAFVARHADWLAEKTAAHAAVAADPVPASVPVRGTLHRLESTGLARGAVRTAEDAAGHPVLVLPGMPEHARRRAADHLKKIARADLTAAVACHAATLGVKPTAIRLKDTTSRWGSASTSGTLCFSWRLAMAPPFVLDYLAAHEVAHLVEMNHSDRFWALCRRLAPRTEEARAWLKAHGRDLHRAI